MYITIDADLASRLNSLGQPVDLFDPSGKKIGQFFPVFDPSEWEAVTPDISEEELDRRSASAATEKCLTTVEVLAYLEKL